MLFFHVKGQFEDTSRHFLQCVSLTRVPTLTLCAVYKSSLCSCYAALYRWTSGYSTHRCPPTLLSPTLTPPSLRNPL